MHEIIWELLNAIKNKNVKKFDKLLKDNNSSDKDVLKWLAHSATAGENYRNSRVHLKKVYSFAMLNNCSTTLDKLLKLPITARLKNKLFATGIAIRRLREACNYRMLSTILAVTNDVQGSAHTATTNSTSCSSDDQQQTVEARAIAQVYQACHITRRADMSASCNNFRPDMRIIPAVQSTWDMGAIMDTTILLLRGLSFPIPVMAIVIQYHVPLIENVTKISKKTRDEHESHLDRFC